MEVAHKQICYLGEVSPPRGVSAHVGGEPAPDLLRPFPLQTKSMKLYEACLTLLQVYSKNNQCRKRSDASAEEDQYQDLLLIMELLTNLLSKEFIDFSDTGEPSAAQDELRPRTGNRKSSRGNTTSDLTLISNCRCVQTRCSGTRTRGRRPRAGRCRLPTWCFTASTLSCRSCLKTC